MAALPTNKSPKTIEHFTHPGHRLSEHHDDQQGYLCDGCKTPGMGKRYRCHGCDFDLHEYCGTCPSNLSLSMHPHPLTLVVRKDQGNRQNNRFCNVCLESVEGLFYRCSACDFDLHPICTRLPESLTHVMHRVHPLKLEAPHFMSKCDICGGVCDSWRYRCGLCSFDMHLQCLLVSCEQSSKGASETHSGRGASFPPQPHPSHGFQYHAQPHQHPHGAGSYGYGYPVGPMPYPMHRFGNAAPPQAGGAGGVATKPGLGKIMFKLVGQLGFGLVTNLVFGADIFSLFSGN